MCIGTNNVYVIGKMIRKFCYSHLIMINTLYTCTVQVRVLYIVQYREYYYFWVRFNFIFFLGGGLAHCIFRKNSVMYTINVQCFSLKKNSGMRAQQCMYIVQCSLVQDILQYTRILVLTNSLTCQLLTIVAIGKVQNSICEVISSNIWQQ